MQIAEEERFQKVLQKFDILNKQRVNIITL